MALVDNFEQASLNARWSGSTASLDDTNNRVDLSGGFLRSIANTILHSEWNDLDIVLNMQLDDISTNCFIEFPNMTSGSGGDSHPSMQIQISRGSGAGSSILNLRFRDTQWASYANYAEDQTLDLTTAFDLRVQRNSSGQWTLSINGTPIHSDIQEPVSVTARNSSDVDYEGRIGISQTSGAFVNSISVASATPTLTIDSVSAGPHYVGNTITLALSNANATGKTLTTPAGALVADSEDENSIAFTVFDPKTFGTKTTPYNSDIIITVTDGSESDSVAFQISPDVDHEYATIIEATGIYSNDIGLAAGDRAYGYWVSGTGLVNLTVGAVNSDGGGTFRYWIQDDTDGEWGSSADVVIPTSSATSIAIPYRPETGWMAIDVDTPDLTSEINTQYSGGTFASGDQLIIGPWVPGGHTINIASDLNWSAVDPKPSVDQVADMYRIAADGTRDISDTVTFVATSNAASLGNASELEQAGALQPQTVGVDTLALGNALESEVANSISAASPISVALGRAIEIDAANHIDASSPDIASLGRALDIESAGAIVALVDGSITVNPLIGSIELIGLTPTVGWKIADPSLEKNAYSDIKKYIKFTASETAYDIGWSHRSFADADMSAFGSLSHESEATLFGTKVLGMGLSKSSQFGGNDIEGYLLTDPVNSIDQHFVPERPFVNRVRLYEMTNELTLDDIAEEVATPDVVMDFSNAIVDSALFRERIDTKRDTAYIAPDVSADTSIMTAGTEYVAEISLGQQILSSDASYSVFPKPIKEAVFEVEKIQLKPTSALVYKDRGNSTAINISYDRKPLDLTQFNRFVLEIDGITVDTDIDTNAISTTNNIGELELNIQDKVVRSGQFEVKLIAYSDSIGRGVIICAPDLRRSNLTINVIAI